MRMFRVIVGGNEYEVGIEEITEKAAAPATRPRAVAPAATKTAPAARTSAPLSSTPSDGTVLAAIPGTIIDVKVNPGDQVKRGDTLMILEAMKMENEIKAPFDGIISTVAVTKGAAVNAGMALLVMT